MPTIPKLEGPRIQEKGLNVSRMNVKQSGIGLQSMSKVDKAAQALNKEVLRIGKEEQDKADQIAILDADQKLSALETRTLYDPETGVVNTKGKDSFSLPETAVDGFSKEAAEIEKSLNSDAQRLAFKKMTINRTKHVNSKVQQHVSRETQAYDKNVTQSYVANEMNAAIQNFDDPARIELAIDRQKGALMSYADRMGMDAETRKQLVLETESSTHTAVISKILNGGSDQRANAYYQKNKKNVTGKDRIAVENTLKLGLLMGDSQRAADKIIAKDMSPNESLAAARDIKDPKKRDETLRRVKSQISDKQFAVAAEQTANYNVAYDAIEENATMDAIPKEVLSELGLSDRIKLEKRVSQIKNGTNETDFSEYYKLELMAGNPKTRKQFMEVNLNEYAHVLSLSDRKGFAKMQADLKAGKGTKELDGISTKIQIVNATLKQGDIEPNAKAGDKDVEKANMFREKVDQLVIDKQDITGKKVTNQELRDITNNLMVEVVTDKGILWDTKKKVFELKRGEKALLSMDDIPQNDVDQIRNALNRKGIPVTDENILKLYTEKIKGLRGDNG